MSLVELSVLCELVILNGQPTNDLAKKIARLHHISPQAVKHAIYSLRKKKTIDVIRKQKAEVNDVPRPNVTLNCLNMKHPTVKFLMDNILKKKSNTILLKDWKCAGLQEEYFLCNLYNYFWNILYSVEDHRQQAESELSKIRFTIIRLKDDNPQLYSVVINTMGLELVKLWEDHRKKFYEDHRKKSKDSIRINH